MDDSPSLPYTAGEKLIRQKLFIPHVASSQEFYMHQVKSAFHMARQINGMIDLAIELAITHPEIPEPARWKRLMI